MKLKNAEKKWQRTSVTNLLRNGQSGTYYVRVKVNGKQKWRAPDSEVLTVAKLRLAHAEKEGRAARAEDSPSGR